MAGLPKGLFVMYKKTYLLIIITSIIPIFLDLFLFEDKVYLFLWAFLFIPSIITLTTFPTWRTGAFLSIFWIGLQSLTERLKMHLYSSFTDFLIEITLSLIVYLFILFSFNYFVVKSYGREKELEKLTVIDPLTEAYNRRSFDEYMNKLVPKALKTNRPLLLIIADIDHFKGVNDTYGHVYGDEVLKVIAAIIKKNIRVSDQLFRTGGEEFAILLPETEIQDGRAICERLRTFVQHTSFINNNEKVPITISLGLAKYEGETVEGFMDKTDQALYKAKRTGRNKVVIQLSSNK
jgi:diguanylate cyclase (GGDEF)-like protein